MRKIYTLLACAALCGTTLTAEALETTVSTLSPAAKAAFQRRADASEELITETPEGILNENLSWNSDGYEDMSGASSCTVNERSAKIVVNGSDIYIYNPISMYATYSWMKGTIDENGKVTVPTPQLIYVDEYLDKVYNYYIARMVKGESPNEYTVVYEVDKDETDLHFTYKNGILFQDDQDILVGLVDANGGWSKYGDMNITALPIEFEVVKPADPTKLDMKMYSLQFHTQGKQDGYLIEMGIDGNDAWVHDITNLVSDCWIKGTVDGDNIIFPSRQFIGRSISDTYEHSPSFLSFFYGATTEAIFYESIGKYGYRHTEADDIVFTKNDNGTWSSPNTIIINKGSNGLDKLIELQEPVFTPYIESPATPKLPEITDFSQYQEAEYCGYMRFRIEPEAADGTFLNPAKIYYNLFLDTPVPYALTQESYPLLPVESITDIPFYFNDGVAIYRDEYYFTFIFYPQGLTRVGVRAYYTGGGKTNHTDISWVNLDTGERFSSGDTGINGIVSESKEIEGYYDFTGRRVLSPEKGIYIVKMKDGRTTKQVINR